MAGTYDKTSIDWQIHQLWQRVGEWVERLLSFPSEPEEPIPSWQLPSWLLESLFWLVVISLTLWLGWQLYYFLSPYTSPYGLRRSSQNRSAADRTPSHTVAQWLQQARRAQQQGNYRSVCRALYLATLQQLNDRHLISEVASRTDGEYLSLLSQLTLPPQSQTLLHALIQTHEQLCFSATEISADMADRCWQAYRAIEGHQNS